MTDRPADFASIAEPFAGIDIDAAHRTERERYTRYIARMTAWLDDCPGATPMEVADARARFREEAGL